MRSKVKHFHVVCLELSSDPIHENLLMSIAIECAIVVVRRTHMVPNWFVESKLEQNVIDP